MPTDAQPQESNIKPLTIVSPDDLQAADIAGVIAKVA
jgi:hypothetical protein